MEEEKMIEELAKRLPTIEEIENEYKEWAVALLRVRFDLKPEAFDSHHKNNYSFENCADCLWNKIKGSIEELLWLRENQIPEGAVVLTKEEFFANNEKCYQQARKETAREILDLLYSQMPKTQIVVEIEKRYGVKITD